MFVFIGPLCGSAEGQEWHQRAGGLGGAVGL